MTGNCTTDDPALTSMIAEETSAQEFAISAKTLDVPNDYEEAAMTAEEVAVVAMGGGISDSLWAETTSWTADAPNRTAITSNDEIGSPYEICHGKDAPLQLRPFIKSGFYTGSGRVRT